MLSRLSHAAAFVLAAVILLPTAALAQPGEDAVFTPEPSAPPQPTYSASPRPAGSTPPTPTAAQPPEPLETETPTPVMVEVEPMSATPEPTPDPTPTEEPSPEPTTPAPPPPSEPPPPKQLAPHPSIRFTSSRQIGSGWPASGNIPLGDWDHNGYEDIALVSNGRLLFYAATAVERFRSPVQIGSGWGNALEIRSVDWDVDGDMDLIARFRDGGLIAYYGDGLGGFRAAVRIGNGWGGMRLWSPVQRSAGGNPAIVSVSAAGQLSVYPSNGAGSFLAPQHLGFGWDSMSVVEGAGDWDKNGRSDLLAVDEHGRLRLYSAATTGTSFSVTQIGNGWGGFAQLRSVQDRARSQSIWAQSRDGSLLAYRAAYTGQVGAWSPAPPGRTVLGAIPWSATGRRAVVPGWAGGAGNGSRLTYQVEVEAGLPADARRFANHVHTILNDDRGWPRSFERVASGGSMRVVLASPALVERLCIGLDTRGYTSCRYGSNVVINAARWASGTLAFTNAGGTMAQYRDYVINHESGHYLGNGHVTCPGSGRLAPVMQQQTHGVLPCKPNGWPRP